MGLGAKFLVTAWFEVCMCVYMYECMRGMSMYLCIYSVIWYIYECVCVYTCVAVPGRNEHYSVAYFERIRVFKAPYL